MTYGNGPTGEGVRIPVSIKGIKVVELFTVEDYGNDWYTCEFKGRDGIRRSYKSAYDNGTVVFTDGSRITFRNGKPVG